MLLFTDKAPLYEALKAKGQPLLADELQRLRENLNDPWIAGRLQQVRRQGEEYLAAPAPHLPYQLFRRYWEDGDRLAFETPYFERRGRLLAFSLLCWLEPEDARWRHALEDTLWLICSEPFWSLPAHFTDMEHHPLPLSEYFNHLDLFASETGFAIAESLAMCGERLAPDVVEQAQLQLEKRIFAPFLDGRTAFKFENMKNNWAAVCGGAIGGAALHRLKDPHALASILHRCLSCLQVYLDSFGEDGVCEEGVGYWNYGFGFFTCFADLLCKRTDGKINLFADPKVAAIAKGQSLFFLSGSNTISFSDGSTHSGYRMGLSCFLQQKYPEAAIPDREVAESSFGDNCYRFCTAIRDLLWYDPSARFGCPAESAFWLPDVQWLISRTEKLQLAAKAGHNGESHNHNDCGSFLLQKQGVPLLCDLGAGEYTAQYFGAERYQIFVNASRSHNLPLIGGAEQMAGRAAAASDVIGQTGETDSLSMELSGCYPLPELKSFKREIRHERAAGRVVIRDCFTLSEEKPVTESFVSCSPIRLGEGCAIFEREGVQLRLTFPQALTPSLQEETYLDHHGDKQTAYLLHLTGAPAKELACEIVIE